MAGPDIIDRNLFCNNCRYNLRGLTWSHLCPECGVPAVDALRTGLIEECIRSERNTPTLKGLRRRVAAEVAGCKLDAILFVSDAIQFASQTRRREGNVSSVRDGIWQMSSQDVCNALRSYARFHFNDDAEAIDLLRDWGIDRSKDLGRIIAAMADERLIRRNPERRPEDFDGLFTLETLFHEPHQSPPSNNS